MIMKSQGLDQAISNNRPRLFVAAIGENADITAQKLVYDLRKRGIWAERDLIGRSIKAQMKYANKLGSAFSMVLGDDEIANKQAELKNMNDGSTVSVPLSAEEIYTIIK